MTDVNNLTEGPKRPPVPLLVQDQLRRKDGKSLAELRSDYQIKVGWGRKYPNLISLSASQSSPLDDPLVRQCHGLVFDMSNKWELIARPTDWFQAFVPPDIPVVTNLKDVLVQERLDGIRFHMYFYRGEWHVGTLTSPDGADYGLVGQKYMSLAEMFWEAFTTHDYALPSAARWGDWTFCFELSHPLKRNVVKHAEADLRLVAARCRNGLELDINKLHWGEAYGWWLTISEFRFKSVDELIGTFAERNPTEFAGYVLVDPTAFDGEMGFKRTGITHPGFHHLSTLRSGMSIQRALEMLRRDPAEVDNLIHHFPEWEPEIGILKHRLADAIASLQTGWDELGNLPEAEFNTRAIGFRMNTVLYQKRKNPEVDIKDLVAAINPKSLLWGLRLRDADL